MSALIPEGFVFVPRRAGENVALQLLEAAEEVDADRVLSVRTVSNGYHVQQDVADRYQENLGEEPEEVVEPDPADGADAKTEELPPLPVTAENTKTDIEKYASELKPAVDVSKAKNKAEMIEILEHARTAPQTEPAA